MSAAHLPAARDPSHVTPFRRVRIVLRYAKRALKYSINFTRKEGLKSRVAKKRERRIEMTSGFFV